MCNKETKLSSNNTRAWLSYFLLLYHYLSPFSQAMDTLTQAQFLRDGQTLVSAGEVFELGLFSTVNSTHSYLGIWYHHLSPQTVIWVANREAALPDSSGSFGINANGSLVLVDGKNNTIWSTTATENPISSFARLMDSGNLVLQSGGNASYDAKLVVWQSFDHPTDTYLFGMRVGLDIRTGANQVFTSWKSDDDPSMGEHAIGIDPRGLAQIIVWNGSAPRWRSGLWNGQTFVGVPRMEPLNLYGFKLSDVQLEQKMYFTYAPFNHTYTRFVVRPNGMFEQLTWTEDKEWISNWVQPSTECDIYNRCGDYGICSIGNTLICSCLHGFEPRSSEEWATGNWSGGCVRRSLLECERINGPEAGNGDGFLKLEGVKLPDTSDWIGNIEENECREECLKNCSCKAYAYTDGIGCLVWGGDLKDMQQFDLGGNGIYIRLTSSELVEKRKLQAYIIAEIIIGTAVLLACFIIVCNNKKIHGLLLGLWRSGKVVDLSTLEQGSEGNVSPRFADTQDLGEGRKGKFLDLPMFSLETIAIATNNFWVSNKLGQGGFGLVYKAKLPSGQEIAVKRLSKGSFQGLEEFKNEVRLIAKLQHRNLVKLLGCCIQGDEKILIYEYMPNKSLDAILFDSTKKMLLNWKKRMNIIGGIARGILYLHRDSRLRVVHRDLKASNILLDEEMNPKISDFGMARIFGGNQCQASTNRVMGTYGYMSPEYAMEGRFSMKSDVYSFGVLLLEILSGEKNNDFHNKHSQTLLEYAWQSWSEKKTMELVDPCIRSSCPHSEVLKCIHVGLLCVQDRADDRPTMASVVFMLGSETTSHLLPQQPSFTPRRSFTRMEPCVGLPPSNGITITAVFGR